MPDSGVRKEFRTQLKPFLVSNFSAQNSENVRFRTEIAYFRYFGLEKFP